MNRIDSFLELLVGQVGSDLHMTSGDMPRVRINGHLQPVRFRELSVQDVEDMFKEIMSEAHQQKLALESSVDFAYQSERAGRFRVNVYRHARGIAAALRVIPLTIPALETLGLPAAVRTTIEMPKGMPLVTGPTGSGKSTTLAAIIDHL